MALSVSAPTVTEPGAIPASLLNLCFVLFVINAVFFPTAFFAHWWIFDEKGLGIPTDFVNVWSAGKLVLDGQPAQAYDWDIQKQVQVAMLGQSYQGNFAWHYPPPFLFVASLLAHFPYAVAFIGWAAVSLVPYLAVMRGIVGRPFGLLLALAFPVVLTNTLVVIAASQWTVFFTAGAVAVAVALASWLAFGTESWQAFFHWMPMFSQAFLTEGRAPWGKMQSIFAVVRYFGGTEPLGWLFQWIMSATVAVVLTLMWRSRISYPLKAAALATGTLPITPYRFLYDVMVPYRHFCCR
jgi:arabinofuranan 3-O-arabinosyltransferase